MHPIRIPTLTPMITRLFLIHRAALMIIALSAFVISKAQKLPEKNVDAAAFNFPCRPLGERFFFMDGREV